MAPNVVPVAKIPFVNPPNGAIPPEVAAAIRRGGDNGPTAVSADAAPSQDVLNSLVANSNVPPAPSFVADQPHNEPAPASPVPDIVSSLQPRFDQQKPQLAPPPKPSLGQRIMKFLPAIGAIGGALEAAGGPVGKAPVGAEMLQNELEKERANRFAQSKLENVEIPEAQAKSRYYDSLNPTKIGVATIGAGARVTASQNAAGAKMYSSDQARASALDVATLRAQVAMGRVTKVLPGINSDTGEPGMLAYNAAGQFVGVVPGALPPAAYLPKDTSTTQFMPDAEGNIVAVPKHTSTGVTLPRGGGAVPNGAVPNAPVAPAPAPAKSASQGGTAPVRPPIQASPVIDASGNQLHKPVSAEAKKTLSQIYSAEGMLGDVMPDLQSVVSEMKRGGNLADTAKVRSAWFQYKSLGLDPSNVDPNSIVSAFPNIDPRLAHIFPTIAMLQIIGSQPYMRGMRNFNYIKQIQAHIPDPEKDTPDLMLSKAQQMVKNLPGLESAIYASEGIGQGGRQGAGKPKTITPTKKDTLGIL